MKTGRNDPCPCGSGKKYKTCCLQKDVATLARPTLDFAYESNLALRRKVTEKLDQMIIDIATKPMMEDFLSEYWGSPFLEEEELAALEHSPQAIQALEGQLEHALRSALLLEGVFPAQYFPDKLPARFSPQEIRFLTDFNQARLTYVQVREFFPEQGYFIADDVFDEKQFKIFDKSLSLTLTPHDIIGGRLVGFPEKDGHVFEILASCRIPLIHKEMVIETISEIADSKVREAQKRRKKVAMPDEILKILKENPLIFFWMDMRIWFESVCAPPPTLANTDGDELMFTKARFACDDLPSLRDALLKQKNFAHRVDKKQDLFTWINQKGFDTGTLTLDAKSGEAKLETNSRERFKKWEKKLKSLATVTLLSKTEESLEALQKKSKADSGYSSGNEQIHDYGIGTPQPNSKGFTVSEPKVALEELSQIAPEMEKFFAERWLKEEIPALGGRTPVEATKTPEGRRKLKDLFKYMENQEARMPNMVKSFDMDKMKIRLGIKD